MTSTTTNPLFKHFRQPQIYIKLPSKGKWWPAGSVEVPINNELPVFAMTARDELTIKTPDALLNGQSTVELIQSCVPNIKNAWETPAVDLDRLLIAIRQATYGNRMEFVSVCPHCNKKNEHAADLGALADTISCPDFEETVKVNDLEVFLKPQTFRQFNAAGIENFEQQRILAVVSNQDLSQEEKITKFNKLFRDLLSLTVKQVTGSVAAVKMSDGTLVDNQSFIEEFFANCDRPVWDAVKLRLDALAASSSLRNIEVKCEQEDCLKSYETPMVFELSSFFV